MTLPVSIFSPAQLAYLLGIAAVLGACLGSFFNCFAWRLVHDESALRGRSHCATCGHVLGPLDLVPVFSWLFLRGRCRYCGERISPRYMLVELFMAAVFVALFVRYGFGAQACAYAALVCILLCLSLVDLDTLIIPNGFIVAGIVLWLVIVWFMPVPQPGQMSLGSLFVGVVGATRWAVVLDGVVAFFAVGIFVLVLSLIMDMVTGRQSLGGGDVKLLAVLGLFLGVAGSFISLFIACICGLVFALMQQVFRGGQSADPQGGASLDSVSCTLQASDSSEPGPQESDASDLDSQMTGSSPSGLQASDSSESRLQESFRMKTIPFGPSIALAAVVTLLVGWQILTWYVGLI